MKVFVIFFVSIRGSVLAPLRGDVAISGFDDLQPELTIFDIFFVLIFANFLIFGTFLVFANSQIFVILEIF